MESKALKCSGKNIVKNHEQNLNVRAHNFKQEPLECVPRNKKSSSKSGEQVWQLLLHKRNQWDYTLKLSTLASLLTLKVTTLLIEGEKEQFQLRELRYTELNIINIFGTFVFAVKMKKDN